ncbi:MAG: ABC transporter substrate-binding protein [Ruminococcaceae bacterium]|jgi:putative ABC transport system substrate-binding protein|nr:ABC transporter substrate-binding protein [Oscillospiraceae bacterium]
MKKLLSLVLALALCLALAACGGSNDGEGKKTFNVGICQLVQHPALDAATKGFRDALEEAMPGQIVFDEKNGSGDIPTCATIVNGFVASNCDLILANATPALQAAASATQTIPVLGTAITEYGVALGIENFGGTVGGNVSGTSDLAPLDQQAAMFDELLPDALRIGILYCSAEANSDYQAKVVKAALEGAGKTVTVYTFADSNDVGAVTAQAAGENDALYIPTDNTAATCAEAINNVAEPAGIPIICGEEGICKSCGIATLSIDYYELGRTTGAMAAKILKGESKIADMPIEYYQNPVKKFNPALCQALNIAVPDGYEAMEG